MHQNKHTGKNQLKRASFSVATLVLLLTLIFVTTSARADSSVTVATIHVPSSCSMVGTINEGEDHSATISGGTYKDEIGKTTIKTTCNDGGGYAVYAIGFTGNSYTGANHNKLVGSNTGLSINTGTYTEGTTTNSVWSMKLTPVSGAYAPTIEGGYNSYSAVPDAFTKVASYPSSTDSITGSSLETTYAVYVSGSQAADTYVGQVKYVLVHPRTIVAGKYSINYDANGGSGTMPSNTDLYNFEPFTLPSPTFTAPTNHIFAGWCTASTSENECSNGILYQPGDEVTDLGSANEAVTLYAVWESLYMQDFTLSRCATQASNSNLTLYDRRDGSDYTVRYMADACWMTQNLRLVGTISATDSNFSGDDFNTLAGGDLLTANPPNWPYTPASHLATDSDISASPYAYTVKELGAWYNICAASAGESCSYTNQDLTQDICPSGWHLPDYGSDFGSISDLTGYINSTGANSNLFGAIEGGILYNNVINRPQDGDWWTSKSYSNSHQYVLRDYGGSLNVDTSYGIKFRGLYIRCVRTS